MTTFDANTKPRLSIEFKDLPFAEWQWSAIVDIRERITGPEFFDKELAVVWYDRDNGYKTEEGTVTIPPLKEWDEMYSVQLKKETETGYPTDRNELNWSLSIGGSL